MLYQPVASQPLLRAISSNPAAMLTGHSYAVLCRLTRGASIARSKLLITIQSHSRSVFPVDTEMNLPPFLLFVTHMMQQVRRRSTRPTTRNMQYLRASPLDRMTSCLEDGLVRL